VEQDQYIFVDPVENQPQVEGEAWGLRRIDQNGDFYFNNNNYSYFSSAGAGVDVFVLDHGVSLTHEEFGGRAIFGTNVGGSGRTNDCLGTGTFESSIIAGQKYGVAKKATIISVIVLECNAGNTIQALITGIDFIVKNATARGRPSVAFFGASANPSVPLETAVQTAISAGIYFVVGAGSGNTNACNYSPGRMTTVITVSSSNYTIASGGPEFPAIDSVASFANIGLCVDIFAPGFRVKAGWIGSDSATSVNSGDYIASAHVAGAVAIRLGHEINEGLPRSTPAQMQAFLRQVATQNKLTNPGAGSPNLIIFSPFQ